MRPHNILASMSRCTYESIRTHAIYTPTVRRSEPSKSDQSSTSTSGFKGITLMHQAHIGISLFQCFQQLTGQRAYRPRQVSQLSLPGSTERRLPVPSPISKGISPRPRSCISTPTCPSPICDHTHTHTRAHAHTRTHAHARTHTHAHTRTHTHIRTRTHTHTCTDLSEELWTAP
jgi:hypothetical protein